jgi:hypothetical protein
MPEVKSPFTIEACVDKSWRETAPHQIDATGWDGQGVMLVEIPLTDDELDLLIKTLQDYRSANPRPRESNSCNLHEDCHAADQACLEIMHKPGYHCSIPGCKTCRL